MEQKKQIISNPELHDYNLILRDIEAIEIQFRLSNEVLTVEKCAELLTTPDLSVDFVAFMEHELSLKSMELNSIKNHKSVLKKLKEYKSSILFADINEMFISKYRKYLSQKLGNHEVTIDSNIKLSSTIYNWQKDGASSLISMSNESKSNNIAHTEPILPLPKWN